MPESEEYRDLPCDVEVIEQVWIPMPDGCRLSARIWLPRDAAARPVPAVLEYIPYRKGDATAARDQLMHPYFAGHGYASVRVDMRGTGDSEGLQMDEYLPLEQEDGQAVIGWLATQPWCSGAVGMIGISWGGVAALQAATHAHPALRAIVPVCASVDRYYDDGGYFMGCLSGQTIGWGAVMLGFNSRPPDPAVVGEGWRKQWLERLAKPPMFLQTWLSHPRRDGYWRQGSVQGRERRIRCAVYTVGGWADCWPNTVSRLLESLPAGTPRKGLSGPWGHAYPHVGIPGPAIGFLPEALRWWDRWLKDIDNGVDRGPRFHAYLQERVPPTPGHPERPGRWVAEAQWPSPRVGSRRFHLGEAALCEHPVAGAAVRVSSPQSCGLGAGEYMPWYMQGPSPQLPLDQRDDDARSVLFDGARLDAPLDLLGTPWAELTLRADAPAALVVARLCDVRPDGASTLISYGILNLAQRAGRERPLPVESGVAYRVRVRLNDTGYRVVPGHRLRLAVSTGYWPIAWPTPYRATLTIDTAASHLDLPVREPEQDEAGLAPFEAPGTAPPLRTSRLRAGSRKRTITHDVEKGEWVFLIEKDAGRQRLHHNDVEMESATTERYVIRDDDPLSARAEYTCGYALGRGSWQTRTRGRLVMTCSADAFFVAAELDACEHERRVFSRDWNFEIPRDGF